MIAYLDTSAVVALLIDEPGTAAVRRIWERATVVVTSPLTLVEGRAALARAERMARIDRSQLRRGVRDLESLFDDVDRVTLDDSLIRRAADLAESHRLRGYDAVHLAAAERVRTDSTVLVAGDDELLRAARELGLATTAA